MFKKYITSGLIISLFNLRGCYTNQVISKKDAETSKYQIDFNQEIYITDKDFTRFHFLPGTYQVANDSLHGKGDIENINNVIPFDGSIAFSNIIIFEQKVPDTGSTIGLIAATTAAALLVVGLIVSASISDAFNPD